MRRPLALAVCLLLCAAARAQVMEWIVKPEYRQIEHMGGNLYKVRTKDGKWGVCNAARPDRLTVPAEYDSITALTEQRALVLDKTGSFLYGILDEEGEPVNGLQPAARQPEVVVMREYPRYSEGLLVVGVPTGKFYNFGYVDKQGNQKIPLKYLYACPFSGGQAMVYTAKRSYQIIDKYGNWPYQGNETINFMSNPVNGEFLLVTGGRRVSRARLSGNDFARTDIEKGQIVDVADATVKKSIVSKGPKGRTYVFDAAMHYVADGARTDYTVKLAEGSDTLATLQDGGLYGIAYKGSTVLSPQFRRVRFTGHKFAIVMMRDRQCGLLWFNSRAGISLQGPGGVTMLAHSHEHALDVNVACEGFRRPQPEIELTHKGKKYQLEGSGVVKIPFFEAHDRVGQTTSTTLEFGLVADRLQYAAQTLTVESAHEEGFRLERFTVPRYTDEKGNARVVITVSSEKGAPSKDAVLTINGRSKKFDGQQSVIMTFDCKMTPDEVKNVSYNISVTEPGSPAWNCVRKGQIEHLSRK